MMQFYITNGSEIILCKSFDDACASAVLEDMKAGQEGLWKVRSCYATVRG